jgi:hypothetical protein
MGFCFLDFWIFGFLDFKSTTRASKHGLCIKGQL